MMTAYTLHFTDCATHANLQGVAVSDGYAADGIYVSDANGDALVPVVADVAVQCTKAGYNAKNLILSASTPTGTVLEECMNVAVGTGGPGTGSGGGTISCFIVSATTGSVESDEVNRMRRLRDRVASRSVLAGELIDLIYRDYEQFSPAIAADLEASSVARLAVLSTVVRPLLGWYSLAGALAIDGLDNAGRARAVQDVLDACAGLTGSASVGAFLASLSAGRPLPSDTPLLLRTFAPRIELAARLPFAAWAILDPLTRVARAATERGDLIGEVAGWLSGAPIDALTPPPDAQLDAQLGALLAFLDFQPSARRILGARVASAWPQAAAALARAGVA